MCVFIAVMVRTGTHFGRQVGGWWVCLGMISQNKWLIC